MFTTTGKMKFKRISLNLIHYFQDYRQLSRICIKDDIRTIGDLEKHIVNVFNIEKSFYLMCKNFFLPPTENIHLLDDNDLIYVMPNFRTEDCDVKPTKKSKSKYKSTDEIEIAKPSKVKKKKSAKYENIHVKIQENNDVETEETDQNKEVKKSKKNVDFNSQVYNMNIEMDLEVSENNKVDITNKNEDIINMEVNDTNGQTEICDNVEERVRKRRRCITPKKQNYHVSSEIFSLKHLNTDNKNIATKDLENEKKATVQSVEIVNKEKLLLYNEQINNHLENRKSYALNEVIDFPRDKTPTKLLNGSKNFKHFRQCSGIGNVVKLLSSDNSINDESDDAVHSENNFITKRKRIRTRRRKPINISNNEMLTDSPIFIPPKTIAAPKSHIKFTTEEKENGYDSLVHSTPKFVSNNEKTGDLNMNSLGENNLSLVNVDPTKCVELSGLPSVNNVILFKKLKIGDNYTPVMSNNILAKVTDVNESGQISVHVLDGHDEFKEPSGRFSCILEEDEETLGSNNSSSSIILERSTLIEPKLLTGITV